MKKIHRFLVDSVPTESSFPVAEKRVIHQCAAVLVLKPGEEIILFEDSGDDQVVSIISIDKRSLVVKKERTIAATPVPRELIAAIAIPKGATFELIVQKLTELGVHTIVPIITGRTVKSALRLDRLQVISNEALEQCGGNRRVVIHAPMTLKECVAAFPFPSIVFDQQGDPLHTPGSNTPVVIYIGPEGGWSVHDDEILLSPSFAKATLGPRVLRTETAAIVASYQLLYGA